MSVAKFGEFGATLRSRCRPSRELRPTGLAWKANPTPQNTNGPEGPLATHDGGRSLSRFPRGRESWPTACIGEKLSALATDDELALTRVFNAPMRAVHLDRTTTVSAGLFRESVIRPLRVSRSEEFRCCHLKPPTRGTVTTTVYHVGRLESSASIQDMNLL